MPHSTEIRTIDGANIRVLGGGHEGKDAQPLVFLHGAGGHTGWMAFLEELSQRFAVYAPEHPGFGQSDDPPWLDGVGDLAYFYLDFLKALGLERVHLMGTSLGGWIAAEMAVRDTPRLASLTLVGAVGITAQGETIPDIFRMPVEETLRRSAAGARVAVSTASSTGTHIPGGCHAPTSNSSRPLAVAPARRFSSMRSGRAKYASSTATVFGSFSCQASGPDSAVIATP